MQMANCWYIRLGHPNPETNRQRHNTVSWEATLWYPEGPLALRWGRVAGYDKPGYIRTGVSRGLPSPRARFEAMNLVESKQRRGYQIVRRGHLVMHN